jgi:hypothetical protein
LPGQEICFGFPWNGTQDSTSLTWSSSRIEEASWKVSSWHIVKVMAGQSNGCNPDDSLPVKPTGALMKNIDRPEQERDRGGTSNKIQRTLPDISGYN